MRFLTALACVATFLLLQIAHAAPAANTSSLPPNLGTFVNLRIEGENRTIFENVIFTRGHNVTTASGFTLECNGLNNRENPLPGPTCTSALDDASKLKHFTWDGTFDAQFDDILVTRIARSAETATQFWGILLNFQFTPVGGCQQEVQLNDKVLWAFDAFNKAHFLELVGPGGVAVKVGEPVTFTVTDGSTGALISNATVASPAGAPPGPQGTTDAQGQVQLTFTTLGVHTLKASRADSLRSNAVQVVVI